MIWVQIITFSVAAGVVLFLINNMDSVKSRKFYYLIFAVIFSVLITTAVGLQARIDTSNIVFGYIIPSIIFSIIICAEAILISIGIKKYANVTNIFLYLPIFLLVSGGIYLITMTIIVSFYPGS
ncbi:hypothetical protein MNBD_GAMMA17-796 [hydrothermal vent metagenome]|uniref:Uncharacterized protein n=1 Tax=hydrothermal vent metagenome TaxID=652676 RepID=A0A3B0Z7H9_9ZZZZ